MANVEGVAYAAVLRLDGEVVDTYTVDSAFPLGRSGPDIGVLAKVSSYLARKINAGSLEYCVLSAERFILVLSPVEIDYALVIGLRQGGNLGKARLQMKKNMERVAAHLRQHVP